MRIYLATVLLLFSTYADAWIMRADFEQGKIGELAGGSDGFTEPYSTTKVSSDIAITGKQSAISSITKGNDGFGEWGGTWTFPAPLGEGDQIWFRTWVYYPTGFDFNCNCPEGIKFIRIRTFGASGKFEGSWDYYLRAGGAVMATGVNSKFYDNHPYPFEDIRDIGGPITTGTWHAYEYYIKFSASPGKGIIRAWLDGKLIFEDKITATLKSSSSYSKMASLWTYWNNMAPKNQSAYVDDVIITNEPPGNRDNKGNLYIGTGNVTFSAAPKPPNVSP